MKKLLFILLLLPTLSFGATCQGSWTDHARFPLTGAHSQAKCQCSSCHLGGFGTGSAGGGASCNSCHLGSRPEAKQKGAGHIQTTADCSVCHSTTISFDNARMNHTGIATGCSNCHKKPTNHPSVVTPTCESCHDTSTGGWSCHAG